jgi:arginase
MRPIDIIEFPTNLGLKEPFPGKEPGVKKLPQWMRQHGMYDLLKPRKVFTLAPPPYSMVTDKESGVRNADAIVKYAKDQTTLLKNILDNDGFPVVIGGDCSILIGNALTLKQMGEYGLFFLDGHTDYGWPELSNTEGAAGMDLAIVTGKGHDKLTNIYNAKPYIKEEHVWCVGNRDFEINWVQAINNTNINYHDLHDVRNTGPEKLVNDFLEMVTLRKLQGFWIHLDVDVLNDEIMPAVDSREKDGLTYTELQAILERLLNDERAVGLEITILDPELDPTGAYTRAFVYNIGNCIKKMAVLSH